MKPVILFLLFVVQHSFVACSQENNKQGKNPIVGGGCEGCEAIYESPLALEKLPSTITLPDYNEAGPKLSVSGVVYKADGKTPARDVIIYVYHTDQTGHYSKKGNETGWGQRHGYIRGWLKTNAKGEYSFLTLKPAAYPNEKAPAHIHVTIKEPEFNEYYIDEYLFDDDPLLTANERQKLPNRAGSGVLKTSKSGDMLIAKRDIYLGKNIPGYPTK